MAGKYGPLTAHLAAAAGRRCNLVELTFDEIARLVGGLPPSSTQRQWWANTGHPQARAWMAADYKVQQVYLDRGRVRFERGGRNAVPPDRRARALIVEPSTATERPVRPEADSEVDVRVVLSWRHSGTVVLDSASRLSIPDLPAAPGLYRLSLPATMPDASRRRIYIGETSSLSRRLAGNYRHPGPTQRTSLRINALLHGHLSQGGAVHLATALTATVYRAGRPQPLDLTVKACRLLAENAALVAVHACEDWETINLP
ncbi:DUF7662 domain-containing protein [Micromonospora okii]|uniref:DUF7662 domain-containing protein n=1 Tax=Micromonospora okii TaxID=1182970 RepID=UPI001E525112|nr:hypothetical protein [Micromonospora okii]